MYRGVQITEMGVSGLEIGCPLTNMTTTKGATMTAGSDSALKSSLVLVLLPFLEGPELGPVLEIPKMGKTRLGLAKTGKNWFS